MSEHPHSARLLRQVSQRMYLAKLGRCAFATFLVLAGVFAAGLLFTRLTGLIPDGFSMAWVLALPVAAGLVALAIVRRPEVSEAARQVDAHERTEDLFLTLTMLDGAAGDYKPLVSRDAEAKAGGIEPSRVVPWVWERRGFQAAAVAGLLVLGIVTLPTLDPFGKVAAAEEARQRVEELRRDRKATDVRKEQLVKQDVDAVNSEETEQALEELKAAFRRMVPEARKENAALLSAHQKPIGEKWKLGAEQLKQLLSREPMQQRFGMRGDLKANDLLKQLQQGSSEGLEEELEEIRRDLEDLARIDDPVKRTEAAQRLKKKLDDLTELARDEVNSRPLAEALERAMKQLEVVKSESREGKLSKEATEALKESLELVELEARKLAQSARDMKELEEALQAIQLAKQANKEGMLDGAACEDCESMQDYMELYAQLMGDREPSMGTGGEGLGEGGEVPEDESVRTDYQDEKTKSAIQKGKMLLAIKTKGVTEDDAEDLEIEYQEAVGAIKQSVSEAIEQEQVPPGYHESIKKYFDSLEETTPDGDR